MKILIVILSLILTGCTVGPNYQPPREPLPCDFSSKTTCRCINWYYSLNDPLLMKLINRAVCCNLDIQKALANIRQSRAQLGIANSEFFPQMDFLGLVKRDRLSANSELISFIPKGTIPLSYTDYYMRFDASWEIDLFGHTRRSVEAACAHLQSQIEQQNNTAIEIAAEVARNYVLYRTYQQRILIAKRNIKSYQETLRLVDLQKQAGYATGVDLDRASSSLLSAQALLPPLEAEARATLAALGVLVNLYPEVLICQLKATRPIPVMKPCMLSVGLPSDLLCNRPDIRVAERELAEATANIGVAVSNLFPRFSLIGDLGSDTVFPGTYFHKASIFWSGGPAISIPIFHGFRLMNDVKAQEAARDAALATYRKTVLQALADVESSLIRYKREQVKAKDLLASSRKLKSTHGLIGLQYRRGESTFLDVLDAERQTYSVDDQYAQSVGQVTINLIALYKALGGGWVPGCVKAKA